MFSSGKEGFVSGPGFFPCVQLLKCPGSAPATQNSITGNRSTPFRMQPLPDPSYPPGMQRGTNTPGPHSVLSLDLPNKSRKHLRKNNTPDFFHSLKHKFSSKLFEPKGGTSGQFQFAPGVILGFWSLLTEVEH